MIEDAKISHQPLLSKISAERPIPLELCKASLDYTVLSTINKVISEYQAVPLLFHSLLTWIIIERWHYFTHAT